MSKTWRSLICFHIVLGLWVLSLLAEVLKHFFRMEVKVIYHLWLTYTLFGGQLLLQLIITKLVKAAFGRIVRVEAHYRMISSESAQCMCNMGELTWKIQRQKDVNIKSCFKFGLFSQKCFLGYKMGCSLFYKSSVVAQFLKQVFRICHRTINSLNTPQLERGRCENTWSYHTSQWYERITSVEKVRETKWECLSVGMKRCIQITVMVIVKRNRRKRITRSKYGMLTKVKLFAIVFHWSYRCV